MLVEVTFRDGSPVGEVGEEVQQADTRQVETFSCGHEVVGPSLAASAAGTEDLEVERRDSEDTTEPI